MLAVVPAFLTRYRLDTTVQGPLKSIAEVLTRALPWLLTLDLAALGSPVAEVCHVGFAPGVPAERRVPLLQALLEGLEHLAEEERCGLMAVKDAAEADRGLVVGSPGQRLPGHPGLPTGLLAVPPGGIEGYLATLSRATRKDLRRKAKQRHRLRVEHRTNVDDVLDRIAAHYTETVANSDLEFEHLPPAYFATVLRHFAPSARIVLYFAGEDLVAFNLLIETPERLVDNISAYTTPRARVQPLLPELAGERRLVQRAWYPGVPGRTGLLRAEGAARVPAGAELAAFQASQALDQALLRLVAKIVSLDRFDPEIARLVAEQAGEAR